MSQTVSAEFLSRARMTLLANDMGIFTKPAPHQYPHQWNWDAAVIALGYSHFDLPRALQEIRSLLAGQWRDGMVPHILYHNGPSDYFPDPDFWQIQSSPNAPAMQTSGITQPPLAASVLRIIHERTPVPDFVREVFPGLLRWHRWLHTSRDADGSGLACLIHPWESGTDDSPRWLQAIANITPVDLPAFRRRDTVHVPGSQRPHQADYDRFIHLVNIFRTNRYNPQALLEKSPFLVQDVFTNSILHRADQDLRSLAVVIGEPTEELDGWIEQAREIFSRHFWDEEKGLFFDFDLRTGAPIRVSTAAAFLPLYAGIATPEQARRLVEEHWVNPEEYAPNQRVRFCTTTTSQSDPAWEPRRYWRGPVWIIMNWLIEDGLRHYGYPILADRIHEDSLKLLSGAGFWEYFDPCDGSGCGSPDFSWSAALALELSSA